MCEAWHAYGTRLPHQVPSYARMGWTCAITRVDVRFCSARDMLIPEDSDAEDARTILRRKQSVCRFGLILRYGTCTMRLRGNYGFAQSGRKGY